MDRAATCVSDRIAYASDSFFLSFPAPKLFSFCTAGLCEFSIQKIMDTLDAPILGIPGINYRMGSMILAELGDLRRFSSPDKILAYAGMSPSTYQSGQLISSYAHMEKRGSRYLRYALFNATRYVCMWDPTFKSYLAKKRAEGKHYYVAISHAAKKLVRLIYHLQMTGEAYCPQT